MLLLKEAKSLDDDDTMSTVSASDSSFASRVFSVSFAEPLIMATYYRPRTSAEEKSLLFYTDAEYREFRHEYIYGRRQARRKVNFASELVTDVCEFAEEGVKSTLYYSDADLQRYVYESRSLFSSSLLSLCTEDQSLTRHHFPFSLDRFLDEFVESLNESSSP
jgi:hypothetical protein